MVVVLLRVEGKAKPGGLAGSQQEGLGPTAIYSNTVCQRHHED